MPTPNTTFELTVDDMEMIEDALRSQKKSLSSEIVSAKAVDSDVKKALHGIQDLLGRLHNQKEFYRPRQGAYVGG
ncbi:MAG: hypothetical protein AAF754_07590 [Pseudomonadota bacterium]